LIFRVIFMIAGIVSCAIGVSASLKLFRETLDSPRWMIAGLALIAFVAGGAAVAVALRPRR
jgi:hypothetical protein